MLGAPTQAQKPQLKLEDIQLPPLRTFRVVYENVDGTEATADVQAHQVNTTETDVLEFTVYRWIYPDTPPVGQMVRSIRFWHDLIELVGPVEIPAPMKTSSLALLN